MKTNVYNNIQNMTSNSTSDIEMSNQNDNDTVNSSTESNATRNIFILIGVLVLAGASIGAAIFFYNKISTSNSKERKQPEDKKGMVRNTKETKQPEEVILSELLNSLKTLNTSISRYVDSRDPVTSGTSVLTLATKFTSTCSLNKKIKEYTQLLENKDVEESIKFSKGISDCLLISNDMGNKKGFFGKMGKLFPVEEKENIEELIKSFITLIEHTKGNRLKDIFEIMSSDFLEIKNNLRDLLLKNHRFNYVAYMIKEKQDIINEIKESHSVLDGFEENKSMKKSKYFLIIN